MANYDEVVLWKAAQPGRDAAGELAKGFDPQLYPGKGPYFSPDRSLAESFQKHYQAGLQEIHLPQPVFEDLLSRGIILEDPFYPQGKSYHVPPSGLAEFNRAMRQGSPNVFWPQ